MSEQDNRHSLRTGAAISATLHGLLIALALVFLHGTSPAVPPKTKPIVPLALPPPAPPKPPEPQPAPPACPGPGGLTGSEPPAGSAVVSPPSTPSYTLTCTGPGGSATQAIQPPVR